MEVRVDIAPYTAIMAGSAQAGKFDLTITDEFVAELNTEEREVLILFVEYGTHVGLSNVNGLRSTVEPMARADLPSLLAYIRRCIAARATDNEKIAADNARRAAEKVQADEEKIRKWVAKETCAKLTTFRPWRVLPVSLWGVPISPELQKQYEAHWAELEGIAREREAASEREATERAAAEAARDDANKTNVCDWIVAHGSESMQARALEGLLPENELLDAVRNWLFAPFDAFNKYKRLAVGDIQHAADCYTNVKPQYETVDATDLTGPEFDRLVKMREVAKTLEHTVEVRAREHCAECRECPAFTRRRSARVAIEWNGHELAREYALTW